MAALQYDVVSYDEVSSLYTEDTPNKKGIGGSELGIITLSQELAREGYSVLVLNDPIDWEATHPLPEEPIVAPSGVHYASWRAPRGAIECNALVIQRFSGVPPDDIKRERTIVWLHDSSGGRNDPVSVKLQEATSRRRNRGGAVPVFVSRWQRDTYPPDIVGRFATVIPNMLPRLVFDPRWTQTPQEDTMAFASAAARGLEATLKAWAEPKVKIAGQTILEVMGPAYDPPPRSLGEAPGDEAALQNRVRFVGSLTLPQLLERLSASRGLIFANTWPETFCLLVAYVEAMGKPARFIGLSPYGPGGVEDTMANRRFLYKADQWDKFIDDLAGEIASSERLTVKPVREFHPEKVLPLWLDALGI